MIGWGEWGDRATGEAIFDAVAHGRIDYYVIRPSSCPDEVFHHAVSSFRSSGRSRSGWLRTRST
jgi:thioredoxin reductase (NADPH)